MSGCHRELSAHFYSAASLRYDVPDTGHDTTPSHCDYPATGSTSCRSTHVSLSAKGGAASAIFKDFGMSWPGIEPVTSRCPEQTLN